MPSGRGPADLAEVSPPRGARSVPKFAMDQSMQYEYGNSWIVIIAKGRLASTPRLGLSRADKRRRSTPDPFPPIRRVHCGEA
jgi:hypothetical protein